MISHIITYLITFGHFVILSQSLVKIYVNPHSAFLLCILSIVIGFGITLIQSNNQIIK